jgi:hypothetical protein
MSPVNTPNSFQNASKPSTMVSIIPSIPQFTLFPPQRRTNMEPSAINRQVEGAVRARDYSASVQRLDPKPRALLDDTNLPIIQAMHPHPSPHHPSIDHHPPSHARSILGFLLDIITKPTPANSSQSGWDLLQYFYTLVLTDQLPPDLREAFSTNYLLALRKGYNSNPQKLRPIASGDSKRRLLCRHIARINAPRYATHFLPHQFAIGISGGADIIIHSLMREVQTRVGTATPGPHLAGAILKLDFINMFNSTSREKIRDELTTHFPALLYIFDLLYLLGHNCVRFHRPDSSSNEFRQEEGESQGCPLASFFSCFFLHRLLASLYTAIAERVRRLNNSDQPFYYTPLLSSTILTQFLPSDGAFIFKFFYFHGPSLGLLSNCDKCSILFSTTGPAFFQSLPPLIQEELDWAATTFYGGTLHDGLIILGTPIGTPPPTFLTAFTISL